jgi:hypothetical protein
VSAALIPIPTEHVPANPNGQHALAKELAAELASVLRRMDAFDGIGEKAASAAMAALPDAKRLGDRLATIDFAFGPGVDHAFASWQLRSKPDADDPDGEVQTDAALAIMLLNEAVFSCPHRTTAVGDEVPPEATALFATCNDVFMWGCSDLEEMRHDQIAEVYGFWEKDPTWGTAVWCMIQRRELAQRPVLERIRKAGIWNVDSLASEHGLRPNHYDGVSMALAMRKRDAYVAWCVGREVEPLPFDGRWWAGWNEFLEAHPGWCDDAWRAGDDAARETWRMEHGFAVPPATVEPDPAAAVGGTDCPDMPSAMRLKLDMRIHRQRLALRENWQIVDRRHWMRRVLHRNRHLEGALKVLRENRRLEARISVLESAIPKGEALARAIDDALHDRFLGGIGGWDRDVHGNVDHALEHDGVVEAMTALIGTFSKEE